jgi:hypothetical protein
MIVRETVTSQAFGIGPNKEAAIANALATLNAMWEKEETTRSEIEECLQRGIFELEAPPSDEPPPLEVETV